MENLKERIAAFQKDSWQLEVFISGGIVFWLFAVTDDFQAFQVGANLNPGEDLENPTTAYHENTVDATVAEEQ